MRIFTLLFSMCLIFSFVHVDAQIRKKKGKKEKTEKEIREELKKELADSLKNQEAKSNHVLLGNNEGIEREALEITYEIKEVKTSYEMATMSRGQHEAIALLIPEATAEKVQKAWGKAIKRKTRSKVLTNGNELYIVETNLPTISNEMISVYGIITGNEYGVKILGFFEQGGTFISSDSLSDHFTAAKKFMKEFGIEQYKVQVKSELMAEEKGLKSLETGLNKLQKQNEKYHKKISDNEQNIVTTTGDIKINENDQTKKVVEISNQKTVVSNATDKDARKEQEKILKSLNKDKKKLISKNKSMRKKIVDYRSAIEESKRQIEMNLTEQDLQKKKIREQLAVVKSVEEKFANIK